MNANTSESFDGAVAHYRVALSSVGDFEVSDARAEHHVECLRDWHPHAEVEDVRAWFEAERAACTMTVEDIPLTECAGWLQDPKTGDWVHESGEFFRVQGVRVRVDSREVGRGGWDQPILTQVGFDGGLLGLLRQRHNGIPLYLVEAKAEPGNFGKLQISPTLQATFSNLKRAHSGRKPRFAEYFESPDQMCADVHFAAWLSEDGGRLNLKRNRGMLVEVDPGTIGDLPPGFAWVSMFQIKALLYENAWISPHIRGIIAHL